MSHLTMLKNLFEIVVGYFLIGTLVVSLAGLVVWAVLIVVW